MKIFQLLIPIFIVLGSLPYNVWGQEENKERHGFWARVDGDFGVTNRLSAEDSSNLPGEGAFSKSFSVTAGYHFPVWSIGLGLTGEAFSTPSALKYAGILLENRIHPFQSDLLPLSFNARVSLPIQKNTFYYPLADFEIGASWDFRKLLWNTIGFEVGLGVGYMPYKYKVFPMLDPNADIQFLDPSNYTMHSSYKINAFLRLGILFN